MTRKIVYFGSEHNRVILERFCRSLREKLRANWPLELVLLGSRSEPAVSEGPVAVYQIRCTDRDGGRLDWCSFELAGRLDECSLLVVDEPFSLAGEAAFALAANLEIPCIVNCRNRLDTSGTAWKWGMSALSAGVLCDTDARRSELSRDTGARIEVVPPRQIEGHGDAAALQLSSLISHVVGDGG